MLTGIRVPAKLDADVVLFLDCDAATIRRTPRCSHHSRRRGRSHTWRPHVRVDRARRDDTCAAFRQLAGATSNAPCTGGAIAIYLHSRRSAVPRSICLVSPTAATASRSSSCSVPMRAPPHPRLSLPAARARSKSKISGTVRGSVRAVANHRGHRPSCLASRSRIGSGG